MSKVIIKVPLYAVVEGGRLTQQEVVSIWNHHRESIEMEIRKYLHPFDLGKDPLYYPLKGGLLVGIGPIKKRITK